MTASTKHDHHEDTMHECSEKDRFRRLERVMFGNGESFPSRMARLEEKVSWILKLSLFMATTWVLTIIGLLVQFVRAAAAGN